MNAAKKILAVILSALILCAGSPKDTYASVSGTYKTGEKGSVEFWVSWSGGVTQRAGAFYDFTGTVGSTAYYRYQTFSMYQILYRNADTNYTKTSSVNNNYTLVATLTGTADLTHSAYIYTRAEDPLYGKGYEIKTFSY